MRKRQRPRGGLQRRPDVSWGSFASILSCPLPCPLSTRRVSTSRTVWLTRAGRALQALLAISTPGSLLQAVFRHWLGLLYVFEALIVVGSMLFSSPSARNFGLTALGLTLALHLASLLAGDLIDRKRGRIILLAALLSIVVLGLAALGTLALYNHGVHGVMCMDGQNEDVWLLRKLCQLL
jgi:hypothetical protein